MYHKSKVFRIHQRERAIAKKKKIAKVIYGTSFYSYDGQYDKGKVHCSCPLCAYHRELDEKIKNEEQIVKKEIRQFL